MSPQSLYEVEPTRRDSLFLIDQIYAWRDRLLASPRFQRAASRLPVMRWIARRKARELHDMTAGFIYSQVLYCCVELRLFDALKPGPMTLEQIATHIGLPEEGTLRLLRSAAALKLLRLTRDHRWGLGERGASMLGNPGVGAMVSHHLRLYQDLADPIALFRGRRETQLSGFWPYARDESSQPSEDAARYSALMAQSQDLIADHVLDACSMKRTRVLMDIGGGTGRFLAAAKSRWPHLETLLFDLPAVVELPAEPSEAPTSAVSRRIGGNMFSDTLPTGADTISLIRILHDHDDEPVKGLLRAVHQALPEDGGRLIIGEPMAGTPGAEPIGDTYFGVYLWAMGSGRPRTSEEIIHFLQEAGFRRCREKRSNMPILTRVIVAEK
ncbi:hydroxyneurosporene methyltransferase [Luminiphilus syltensis NOR5-1B]|uniref:Hydroxyneurosporene methyltransferase n=1 Tax=Luminiphilus syltensis NOR5-1B TaxID=565045 RepID=B8KT20_9GAMM|nr:methyltransferase [Luminiphilus syltensis]EED34943.1 hydroxyneurosporene methyltransferase [Luminiphilus syltensis NOR5-1B]